MSYACCPSCARPMEVERVHNGVMVVWHGVHCGWGQDGFHDDDVYEDYETCWGACPIAEADLGDAP